MANTLLRFDPSVVLDIQLRISRDGAGVIEFYDEAGDPVDMYETEWELLLKKQAGVTANLIRLTTSAGDLTITGTDDEKLRIAVTQAVTAIPSSSYYYELYRPDLKKTWFTGTAIVVNGVFMPPA